jgi:hypothetical protein
MLAASNPIVYPAVSDCAIRSLLARTRSADGSPFIVHLSAASSRFSAYNATNRSSCVEATKIWNFLEKSMTSFNQEATQPIGRDAESVSRKIWRWWLDGVLWLSTIQNLA